QVWVQCSQVEDKFHMNVEDNGKGFDPQHASMTKEGIGISNIRNRVDILNGQLEIDAAVGNGASFHIQLDIHG
ncbi:ATP-binding protein, partial [Sphingobacterium thalpophilum]|uniref:ATP-binding protein n=2 Tax=Sphingobacterium TaxID=28453 RepID=UPI0031D34229